MELNKPNEELHEKLKAGFDRIKKEVIGDEQYLNLISVKTPDGALVMYQDKCSGDFAAEAILSILKSWKEKGLLSYLLLVMGVCDTMFEDMSVDELDMISKMAEMEIKSRKRKPEPEPEPDTDMAQEVAKILRGIGE